MQSSESVVVGSEEIVDVAKVVDVAEVVNVIVDVAAIVSGGRFGRYLSLWEWEASRPRRGRVA